MKNNITTRDEEAAEYGSSSPKDRFVELVLPYYFSGLARKRGKAIGIGSYVKVSGLEKKYELIDIFPQFGSVRVREVGGTEGEGLLFPWSAVTPWKKEVVRSKTVVQSVGNWLFGGNRVYRLEEPDRMLKQRKIHWDRQTCDVEDEDGRVLYDVSWDDLEFWDPVEYHLADDE